MTRLNGTIDFDDVASAKAASASWWDEQDFDKVYIHGLGMYDFEPSVSGTPDDNTIIAVTSGYLVKIAELAQGAHDFSVNSPTPSTDTNYNGTGATGANALAAGVSATASSLRGVAIGIGASANGANDDVSIGREAGLNTLAANGSGNNVAIGTRAGQNVTGIINVAVGNTTGNNVIGQRNTAIGGGSGRQVTGGNNAAFGWSAGNQVRGTEITVTTGLGL